MQTEAAKAVDHASNASRSLLAAGVGIVVAVAYGYTAFTGINASPLDDLITSSGVPKILAGLLFVLALIEGAGGLASKAKITTDQTFELLGPLADRKLWEGPLLVLGTGFLYIMIVPIIGYPFAIAVVAAATALAAGARNAASIIGVSALISAVYFILFQYVMGTGQPLGLLSGIL